MIFLTPLSAHMTVQRLVQTILTKLWGGVFPAHIANKSNPHSVTLSQIGAEPVQTVVTQTEAASGSVTAVRSWTPQRVREAVIGSPVYRLSYGSTIPNGSDLDDYTTPGIYSCSSATNAQTLVNPPRPSCYATMDVASSRFRQPVASLLYGLDSEVMRLTPQAPHLS